MVRTAAALQADFFFCPYRHSCLAAFLGAALFSQVGGYLAISYALGSLPASVVSPTMLGQPVMTAVLAMLLLGEALYPAQVVGGAVVLLGIYWVHRGRNQ